MEIRLATIEDAQAIYDIEQQSFLFHGARNRTC